MSLDDNQIFLTVPRMSAQTSAQTSWIGTSFGSSFATCNVPCSARMPIACRPSSLPTFLREVPPFPMLHTSSHVPAQASIHVAEIRNGPCFHSVLPSFDPQLSALRKGRLRNEGALSAAPRSGVCPLWLCHCEGDLVDSASARMGARGKCSRPCSS